MFYSHPENNTEEKKLKEGRRNPTSHRDICVTQKHSLGCWRHHTEGEGCREEGSFQHSILELPHENLMKKQQHWHSTQHICTDGHGEATQTCPDPWHSAYSPWEQCKKHIFTEVLREGVPGVNTPQIMQEARPQYLSFDVKVCQKIPGMASAGLLSDLKSLMSAMHKGIVQREGFQRVP